jgi:hypothetical protein
MGFASRSRSVSGARTGMHQRFAICVACFHESDLLPARYCADCDREVCTFCIVEILETHEFVCPRCARERENDSEPMRKPERRKGRGK